MGKRPVDYDLATSARPEQIQALFSHTIDIGKKFGTIILPTLPHPVEVTTLRKESRYHDNRHPEMVQFCEDIHVDLARRDFTMNAMAYDLEKRLLIDPFEGRQDIAQKTIRCVGDPYARLQEDTLRIIRASRFSAQLGFRVAEQTDRAIRDIANAIPLPSPERIRNEVIKLLSSPHVQQGLTYLMEWGLSKKIFSLSAPALADAITKIPPNYDTHQILAFLFATVETNRRRQILQELRFSNKEIRLIQSLVANHFDYQLAHMKISDLQLKGNDLKQMGYRGIHLGTIQKTLLQEIKNQSLLNKKENLMNFVLNNFTIDVDGL